MIHRDKIKDFAKVIEENKGIIYKVANAYCRQEEERKDLVQEITIQIWKSCPRYDHRCKLSTWMYRIALNVTISWYRKKSRNQERIVELEENLTDLAEHTENDTRVSQISQLLQFIHELKELDKGLMLLYLDEKSYEEIAEILGISKTNVATKISRIKKLLKEKFLHLNH